MNFGLETDLLRSKGESYLTGPVQFGASQQLTGMISFFHASSVFATSFKSGNASADATYTWPTALPAGNNYLLGSSTAGVMSWINAPGTYAPIGAAFVTIGNDATLTADRALTGTANQITVTDNGANSTVVLSTPQNIHTAATPTFASETLTATSNQLVLGTTRTVTLTAPTPATTSRTVTFPDLTADYSVVGVEGTQTISGIKTFSTLLTVSRSDANQQCTFGNVSRAGGDVSIVINNTDNTNSASGAKAQIQVGGTSAGDPHVFFTNGTTEWVIGFDNSATEFKLSRNSSFGTNDTFGADASLIYLYKNPKFAGTNSTGAGSAALGANSPATTNTAPYTWIQAQSNDGSTVYIPCWK